MDEGVRPDGRFPDADSPHDGLLLPLAGLGDLSSYVFLAYLLALGPWAILVAYDILDDRFRTIRRTRELMKLHLIMAFFPAIYISFYATLQVIVEDYKEMSAALAAITIALLHLARTAVGYIELHFFVKWATHSQKCLASLGYVGDAGTDIQRIKVNHDVIDNSLRGGDLKCGFMTTGKLPAYLLDVFSKVCRDARGNPEDSSAWSSSVRGSQGLTWHSRVRDWVSNAFMRIAHIMHHVISQCCHYGPHRQYEDMVNTYGPGSLDLRHWIENNTPWLKVVRVPQDPLDAWVRWAVVFLAQSGRQWLDDCIKRGEEWNQMDIEKLDPEHLDWDSHRDEFASLLWATCMLQVTSAGKGQRNRRHASRQMVSLLTPQAQMEFLHEGVFSKEKCLASAIATGLILPYGAPGLDKSREDGAYLSLKRYETQMKVTRDSLPAHLQGPNTRGINLAILEWFMILMHLATIGSLANDPICLEAFSDDQDVSDARHHAKRLVPDDVAVTALRDQLGFPAEYSLSPNSLPIPLTHVHFGPLLWRHPGLLQASVHLDNWVALRSGESLEKLLLADNPDGNIGEAKEAHHCKNDSHNHGVWSINTEAFTKAGAREHSAQQRDLSRTTTMTESQSLNKLADIYTNPGNSLTFHSALEKLRLEHEIERPLGGHFHFDQTIQFLGTVMEHLRSAIADWVEWKQGVFRRQTIHEHQRGVFLDSGQLQDQLLRPRLDYVSEIDITASTQLMKAIQVAVRREHDLCRSTKQRLLWECQNALYETVVWPFSRPLRQGREGLPATLRAMLLCVLAFPSIIIRIDRLYDNSSRSGDFVSVTIHEARRLDTLRIRIIPVAAPQNLHICVRPVLNPGESMVLKLGLQHGDMECQSHCFWWELWRDAFLGRVKASRAWKRDFYVNWRDVFHTPGTICRPIIEVRSHHKRYRWWDGWLPIQASIAKFESSRLPDLFQTSSSPDRRKKDLRHGPAYNRVAFTVYRAGVRVLEDILKRHALGAKVQTNTPKDKYWIEKAKLGLGVDEVEELALHLRVAIFHGEPEALNGMLALRRKSPSGFETVAEEFRDIFLHIIASYYFGKSIPHSGEILDEILRKLLDLSEETKNKKVVESLFQLLDPLGRSKVSAPHIERLDQTPDDCRVVNLMKLVATRRRKPQDVAQLGRMKARYERMKGLRNIDDMDASGLGIVAGGDLCVQCKTLEDFADRHIATGSSRSASKILQLAGRCIDHGHVMSVMSVATRFLYTSRHLCFPLWEKCADAGTLPRIHIHLIQNPSRVTVEDVSKVLEIYQRSFDRGNELGIYYAGEFFREGLPGLVPRDIEKAVRCFKTAVDHDFLDAVGDLARLYLGVDPGVEPDIPTALELLQLLADRDRYQHKAVQIAKEFSGLDRKHPRYIREELVEPTYRILEMAIDAGRDRIWADVSRLMRRTKTFPEQLARTAWEMLEDDVKLHSPYAIELRTRWRGPAKAVEDGGRARPKAGAPSSSLSSAEEHFSTGQDQSIAELSPPIATLDQGSSERSQRSTSVSGSPHLPQSLVYSYQDEERLEEILATSPPLGCRQVPVVVVARSSPTLLSRDQAMGGSGDTSESESA